MSIIVLLCLDNDWEELVGNVYVTRRPPAEGPYFVSQELFESARACPSFRADLCITIYRHGWGSRAQI